MEFSISTILFTIINFIILMFILRHFLWDKIEAAIAEREDYIEDKIMKADEEAEKARIFRVENERLLKQAKKEGKKIIEEEKRKAEKIYSEIVEEAKIEANLILERARVEINREKEKAEYGLKKEAIELALALSSKVIEKNIDEDINRKLINDFISEVGN